LGQKGGRYFASLWSDVRHATRGLFVSPVVGYGQTRAVQDVPCIRSYLPCSDTSTAMIHSPFARNFDREFLGSFCLSMVPGQKVDCRKGGSLDCSRPPLWPHVPAGSRNSSRTETIFDDRRRTSPRPRERGQGRTPIVVTLGDAVVDAYVWRVGPGATPARQRDLLIALQELAGQLDPLQFEILKGRIAVF
jgi:hypothetical protein